MAISLIQTSVTIDLKSIAQWATIVLPIASVLGILINSVRKSWNAAKKLKEGLRVLLHYRLDKDAHRVLDRGFVTPDELETITDLYNAYHDLGGNGSGTRIFEKVLALPTKNTEVNQ